MVGSSQVGAGELRLRPIDGVPLQVYLALMFSDRFLLTAMLLYNWL